jgi:hypothetical protein
VKKKIFSEFYKTMLFFFYFSSDKDLLTYDDSNYHSASEFSEDVKIGCFDS